MAAAFRSVNTSGALESSGSHISLIGTGNTNDSTDAGLNVQQQPPISQSSPASTPLPANRQTTLPAPTGVMDDSITPTRASFGGGGGNGTSVLASQKPLPTSPFPQAVQVAEVTDPLEKPLPKRENSQHSRKSRDSEDVEMNDSDGEDGAAGEEAGSDDESVNADGGKSKSKKKSQRFYCTDYPPCNLSFTRSEHLARHIRKHTGERPFQCHCSRRFSRLDNLRQHAQTVHVNEDIPIDSLAAVGTRFVRQVRQERVRQNGRARASTAGSVGAPVRGHSKSLSTSSITSVGSVGSNYSARDEAARRRPPPLVMADPHSRFSLESYRSPPDGPYVYRPPSPSDFSTPTSATFSTGQSSPRWGSGVASPVSSHSRSHSMYASGSRTPGRRLSVPSGNPFQSPIGAGAGGITLGRPLFGPGSMNASNTGAFSPASGSLLASPTSAASNWSRRESTSSVSDEAWRRRTWHPDSREYSVGASRLSNVITLGQFQSTQAPSPAVAPAPGPAPGPVSAAVPAPTPAPPLALANSPGQKSNVRLPGIESFFDPNPPRRVPSPMVLDSEIPAPAALLPAAQVAETHGEDRRLAQWDMGLHRGLTRLDITSNGPNTPPRDSASAWAREADHALQVQAEQVRAQPTVRFEAEATVLSIPPLSAPAAANGGFRSHHQHTMSAPSITTPREAKRHGWYHGPVTIHGVTGENSEHRGEQRGPHVGRMVHPNLANGFSGFPARGATPVIHQPSQIADAGTERLEGLERERAPPQSDSMRRLEALVAVATSESSAAAAY